RSCRTGKKDVASSTWRAARAGSYPPGKIAGTPPKQATALTIQECQMSDFKPGLEGVIAFETEIAEPDKEGGALRYRGVDIEELVGHVSYDNVWGLLVDDDVHSRMPDPEPHEPCGLTGNAPSDLQTETARLSGVWGLGKLNEISAEQSRDDLGRLS